MPDRIHIGQMVYNFHIEEGGGGITRRAIDIAQKLDSSKFKVSIFGLGHTGTEAEDRCIQHLNQQGFRALAITPWSENKPYISFSKAYLNLKHEIKRHPVDILHSHSEFTDIAASFLKIQRQIPIILRTTHYGYNIEWRKNPVRRAVLTNFLYPIVFEMEVGVNPTMRDRLNRRIFARLLGKEALFFNEAVELDRFEVRNIDIIAKKNSLGVPPDAQVVGCVGRLVEQKGHTFLLTAIAEVIKTHPDVYYLIVGDGPLGEELKVQANDLGIKNRVIFTGSRSDIEELLACLDIFVLASLWEGMPISIMESMASRTPVLATDIPGTRDLIQHGKNGWLVPPANPIALSLAIINLLESPALRNSLALTALDTVQHYSINSVTKRYESIYQSLYAMKVR